MYDAKVLSLAGAWPAGLAPHLLVHGAGRSQWPRTPIPAALATLRATSDTQTAGIIAPCTVVRAATFLIPLLQAETGLQLGAGEDAALQAALERIIAPLPASVRTLLAGRVPCAMVRWLAGRGAHYVAAVSSSSYPAVRREWWPVVWCGWGANPQPGAATAHGHGAVCRAAGARTDPCAVHGRRAAGGRHPRVRSIFSQDPTSVLTQ
jgi:hypothetical protein